MRKVAKELPKDIAIYFYYDETSPSCLRWRFTRYSKSHIPRVVVYAGDVAGHLRKDGYWSVKLFGESIKVHRIIYALEVAPIGDSIIDHIDGDNSNNKKGNLKASSDYLNGKNKAKYNNNSTGVTGVHINEKSEGNFYYIATWREVDKSIGAKSFSWNRYGKEEAFKLACSYREDQMKRLISEGAEYTERHGN